MPFVPVANVVLAEIRMLQDSQHIENTLYFKANTTWTTSQAQGLADDLVAWWSEFAALQISDTVVLTEVVVTDLTTNTGFQVTAVPAAAAPGTQGGAALPNLNSIAISFRTANRGRSFRGRNYIVGLPETLVVGNNVVGTLVDDWITAYNNIFFRASTNDCVWVVVSRFSGVNPTTNKPIPRTAGIATPITTVVFVDQTIDSQTRRGPTRGK